VRIKIEFPDGGVFETEVNALRYESLEDMAEDIARELVMSNPRLRETVKDLEACIEAHKRWILPRLVSALAEYFGW